MVRRLYALPATTLYCGGEVHLRLIPHVTESDLVVVLRENEPLYRRWEEHLRRAGMRRCTIKHMLLIGNTAGYKACDYPDYKHETDNYEGGLLAERVVEVESLDDAENPLTRRALRRPRTCIGNYEVLPIATTARAWQQIMLLTASLHWNPGNKWSPGFFITDFRSRPGVPPHEAGIMLFGTELQKERLRLSLRRIVKEARSLAQPKRPMFVSKGG